MKKKRGSKKIIVISIITIVVLGVIASLFFSLDNELPLLGRKDANSEIIEKCSEYCSKGYPSDFCKRGLEINVGSSTYKGVTCYYLSQKMPEIGVEGCPEFPCEDLNVRLMDEEMSFGDSVNCEGNEGKRVFGLVKKPNGNYFLTSSEC